MSHTHKVRQSSIIKLLTLSLLLFTCLADQPFALADNHGLTFNEVWIAEAPPVSRVLAAYMTIENNTDKDIQISSAISSSFSSTTFHKTIFENGMAKMRHKDSLIIPANGSLELKPGGLHMMLFNPVTPLREGDSVSLSFELSNKKTITINANVKKTH